MAQLEGIHIQNFRSLKDVRLGKTTDSEIAQPLPTMFTIIGPNGAGKSALLDAFGFLGDCLHFGVEEACDKFQRGGFNGLRTKGSQGPIKFELRYREAQNTQPINYTLHIDSDHDGHVVVVHERLTQRRKGQTQGLPLAFFEFNRGAGFAWTGESTQEAEGTRKDEIKLVDPTKLGIATLGNLNEHERIVRFRRFLEGWYLSYFTPDLARVLPTAGAHKHLNRRGDNLANYLQYMERRAPERFKRVLGAIAKKIPGIESVEHEISADNRLLLKFTERGYSKPLFAQDMSDGTLKMLAYLLLLEDPEPAFFIAIDEPENGLHHQLLEPLAQEMKRASQLENGPQIAVTTHSPYFADALSPREVWIIHKNAQGSAEVSAASAIPGVQALFDEGIPLGELWFGNHFGIGSP